MRFSERMGYKKVFDTLQTQDINETLRNQLWNSLYIFVWEKGNFDYEYLQAKLCFSYFKKRLDQQSYNYDSFLENLEKYFFKAEWYEVYDLLEEILRYFENEELNQ